MGSVNDIGLMIAVYIMMKAHSYFRRKEESKVVKSWAVITIIVSALFIFGWIVKTFGIFGIT